MTSDRKLRFAAAARHDLRAVFRYATETWGDQQADAYGRSIEDALRRLIDFPELGRRREDIRPGRRGHVFGQHPIPDRVDDAAVVEWRIVQTRMDVRSLSNARSFPRNGGPSPCSTD